ncbi:MAG: HAMP domain-containing protein [Actinobacteria bacterium]|nr:HAMP domain-containing protein [Actinomycetota bacterium]
MRARITAVATLIAGAAVAITAAVILHAVETSLENDLHGDQVAAIERVGDALRSGAQPNELDLASIFAGAGTAGAIQVLDQTGRVVATTPGAESLAPIGAGVVSGDGMIPSLPDGADQPTLLTPTGVSVAGARPTGTSGAPGTAGQPVGIDEVSEPFTTAEWLAAIRGDASDVSVSQGRVYLGSGAFTVVAASPLAPVRESLAAVEGGLVIALPLLVLIVAISTWFLTGRALRPVEAIRSQVESISGTTLARRVPDPGTGDEIGRLAATMNQMLDRLESAAQRQQQFIADASHELRSPVATIRAYLEVARHTADTTDWSAVVDDVLTEEARLEATIADLLLSASLDEGAPIRDAEPVDLAALAHDLDRRPRPEQPALRIEVPEQAIVHGSRVQLDRAVSNLVDNALRHAASSVQVTVISIGGDAGPDPRRRRRGHGGGRAPRAPRAQQRCACQRRQRGGKPVPEPEGGRLRRARPRVIGPLHTGDRGRRRPRHRPPGPRAGLRAVHAAGRPPDPRHCRRAERRHRTRPRAGPPDRRASRRDGMHRIRTHRRGPVRARHPRWTTRRSRRSGGTPESRLTGHAPHGRLRQGRWARAPGPSDGAATPDTQRRPPDPGGTRR